MALQLWSNSVATGQLERNALVSSKVKNGLAAER
jgi:hypothetical protein